MEAYARAPKFAVASIIGNQEGSFTMLNGRPFEYTNLSIFLHTSFLFSYFHFEFKVLYLGCEVVNLSMGPLGIGSPLLLPNVPIVLDKALSCIEVGSIPISWSNSFLFRFLILKIGQCLFAFQSSIFTNFVAWFHTMMSSGKVML